MTEKYRLIPTVDTARLGPAYYLFDRAADSTNVIYVPTQKVSEAMANVVQRIKKEWTAGEFKALAEVQALFDNPADIKKLSTLLAAGYIEVTEQDNVPASAAAGPAATGPTGANPTAMDHVAYFQRNSLKHYLKKLSFFNLPAQIENEHTDIGVVGMPVSSVPDSSGTIFGPDRLRQHSQKAGFWFDFNRDGVYTEVGCDDSLPSLICRNIVMKDFGNLGVEPRTVGELFAETQTFVDEQIMPSGIRPLFIGGDHIVTFPIVNAMLKHHPSMVLLHLDAHNDLFYTPQVDFNHAGPIHGLLMQSNLSEVYSYGLRTNGDPRVKPYSTLENTDIHGKSLSERVHLHSLGATRRKLQNPIEFARQLKADIGESTPVYLTIDLDVLTDTSMGNQLSTPCGHGLEWYELYECVALMTNNLNVVGADIVEYSVEGQIAGNRTHQDATVLLMHTAEGLYKSAMRNGKHTASTAQAAASHNANTPKPTIASKVNGNINYEPVEQGHDLFDIVPLPRVSINDIDYDTFVTEYVNRDIPLILTDCTDNDAFQHWSFDYFLERVNRRESIPVKTFNTPFDYADTTQEQQPLWDALATMRRRKMAGLGETDARLNIVDWAFGDNNAALYADIPVHPFFANDISSEFGFDKHALKWIYFGEPGTGSPTHIDVVNSNAWLLLASGKKRWRMVHRDSAERCRANNTFVDLFYPDPEKFTQLEKLQVWQTDQLPGEIVWTPTRCVHAVQNLEFSIAVTQNYVDLTNLLDVHKAVVAGQQQKGLAQSQCLDVYPLLQRASANASAAGYESALQLQLAALAKYSEQIRLASA